MSTGSAHDGALPAGSGGVAPPSGPAGSPPTTASAAAADATARLRAEVASLRGETGEAAQVAAIERSGERERRWPLAAVARGLALFLGAFTLANLVATLRTPAFDGNVWWVDPPSVPRPLALALFCAVGVALIAYALAPRMAAWRRWTTIGLCAAFATMAVLNAVDFYRVWRDGLIQPGVPAPLSVVVVAALGYVAWAALRPPQRSRRRWPAPAVLALTTAVCVVLFPLLQVWFFGGTDYRRPADVAVVFGAQVHRNGLPSTSLRDRMTTAEQLYKDRLVGRLIVSGGVGESGYNEALVMRDMAVKAGVPARAIVIDSSGVSTDATVRHTVVFFAGRDWRRVLAVSQGYHLPRIKLAYQRAGWDVLTVPATTSAPIAQTPRLVAREIPAFWAYYLRAVLR
jgi:vancomycin permeability regulator SanA